MAQVRRVARLADSRRRIMLFGRRVERVLLFLSMCVLSKIGPLELELWVAQEKGGLLLFKGAVSRYSVIFCAFFARAKNGGCSRKCHGHRSENMKAWPSARPGSLATYAGCWHDSAVNQRQVEPELHCFTCRRRQAVLLFSGYEARARWYPLLQGSRLAATAISVSILYSGVWFCAPSEACFGDLVAESVGDWEKESAVWSQLPFQWLWRCVSLWYEGKCAERGTSSRNGCRRSCHHRLCCGIRTVRDKDLKTQETHLW